MKKTRVLLAWLLCLALCFQSIPLALGETALPEAAATQAETAATTEPTAPPTAAPTHTPEVTHTPEPTATPEPTHTPEATHTPAPTESATDDPEATPSASPETSATPEASETPEPSATPDPSVVLVSALTLTAPKTELAIGETLQLTASVSPEDATDASVTFVSADTAIATVDETGLVTAVSLGEVVITATANDEGGATAGVTLTVVDPHQITALALAAETTLVVAGEKLPLTLAVTPETADGSTVVFSSGDEAIATVDAQGVVTAVAEGEVVITVMVGAAAPQADATVPQADAAAPQSDTPAVEGEAAAQEEPASTVNTVTASITLNVLPLLPYEGEGTEGSPYLLSDREHLALLARLVALGDTRCISAHFAIANDIEVGDRYQPIGTAEHPFEGAFDGRGFKLRGLSVLTDNPTDDGYGLFGTTSGAKLARIAVELGGLDVRGDAATDAGLIVGRMLGGSLTESYSTGYAETSLSNGATGGLVGRLSGGVIDNCFSLAKVSAAQNGGVLAGISENGAQIIHSYNRTEPSDADIEKTVGRASSPMLSSVYILTAEDKQAESLAYTAATTQDSYDGFDFDGTWELDDEADFPFPVLQSNPYTGIASYGPSDMPDYATGDVAVSYSPRLGGSSRMAAQSSAALPTAYDLRNYGYVPAVRNQNPYGTCWSFASVAALETNMIKNRLAGASVNLAELHTVWFTDFGAEKSTNVYEDPLNNFSNDHPQFAGGDILNFGGNAFYAAYTFATGMTPSAEDSRTAYSNAGSLPSNGLPYSYAFSNSKAHVQGVRVGHTSNRDQIKQMIMKYGAVTVSYFHNGAFLSSANAYYVPSEMAFESGGHAVTIIGWNDNYSRYKFNSKYALPANDGAWLIRNSWGENWGNKGYFWASYDSYGFSSSYCIAMLGEAGNGYDSCYQYDGSTDIDGSTYISGGSGIYAANIFTAQQNDKITDVGFWCVNYSGISYTVSAYKLNEGATSPTDGTPIIQPTGGTTDEWGFYKVSVTPTGTIGKGDRFSVIVRLNGVQYFDAEMNVPYGWMKNVAYAKKGQSWISADGATWKDVNADLSETSASLGKNLRIKAYTQGQPGMSIDTEDGTTIVPLTSTMQMVYKIKPSTPSAVVEWSVENGTGTATIDENGLITAGNKGAITVHASTTITLDGEPMTFTDSMALKVDYLPAESVTLRQGLNDVTNKTVSLNVSTLPEGGKTYDLSASVLPALAQNAVTWSLEKAGTGATYTSDGRFATLTVTGDCNPTLVATAAGGTEVSARFTVETYVGPSSVSVTGERDMASGGSQTLLASVLPTNAEDRSVAWSIVGGSEYAQISSAGILTTQQLNGNDNVTVTVRATSADAAVYKDFPITLHPVIDEIALLEVDGEGNERPLQDGQRVYLDLLEPVPTLRLRALATPTAALANYEIAASNTSVISVAPVEGTSNEWVITPVTRGSATLTVKAKDAARASFQLLVAVDQYVREIDITGPAEVARGKSTAFKADVLPATALNKSVAWSVSWDESVTATQATISSSGVLTVLAVATVDSVTVTATAKDARGVSATYDVTVCPPVASVEIKDANNDTINGQTVNYDLYTAEDARMQLHAVTAPEKAADGVAWKLNTTRYVSLAVDEATGVATLTPLKVGRTTVTATATDGSGKSASVVISVLALVKGVEIHDDVDKIAAGKSIQLKVDFKPDDATNKRLTWTSDNTAVGTVSASGRVSAKPQTADALAADPAPSFTVTVASAEDPSITNERTFTVKPAVTSVTFDVRSNTRKYLDLGETLQLIPTIAPANASSALLWTSSNKNLATVNEDTGLVTANDDNRKGNVTIYATAKDGSGKRGSYTLAIVSAVEDVTLTGASEAGVGKSVQLTAQFTPTDATNKRLVWSINPEASAIATVSQSGRVSVKRLTDEALAADPAPSFTITVVSAENPSITATHTITVKPAVTSVTVSAPANEKYLDLGGELQLTSAVLPQSASSDVLWSSSNKNLATVHEHTGHEHTGLVIANDNNRKGNVTIYATAKDGSGKRGSYTLAIVSAVEDVTLTGASEVGVGKSIQLKVDFTPGDATNKRVVWTSSNPAVATVNQSGRVTAQRLTADKLTQAETSTAFITVTSMENGAITARHDIRVKPIVTGVSITESTEPTPLYINLDEPTPELDLHADCQPSDASRQVSWRSSNTRCATVNPATGRVTAVNVGTARIYATARDGSGRSSYVNVRVKRNVQRIDVTGTNMVAAGRRIRLTATVVPANATERAFTWASSDPTVATVDRNGYVKGMPGKEGQSVEITATSKDVPVVVGRYTVTVSKQPVYQIYLDDNADYTYSPTNCYYGYVVDFGTGSRTFTVSARCYPADYRDYHTQEEMNACMDDVSQDVVWSSTNSRIASIDPVTGVVTAHGIGKVMMYATTMDGSSAKVAFMVFVEKMVHAIEINYPATASGVIYIAKGRTVQLTAALTPADATNKGVKYYGYNDRTVLVRSNGRATAYGEVGSSVQFCAETLDEYWYNGDWLWDCAYIRISQPTTSVRLTAPSTTINLAYSNQLALTYEILPQYIASPVIRFTSSNPSVATVDADGIVTAHKNGSVRIGLLTTDGTGKSAYVNLRVVTQ